MRKTQMALRMINVIPIPESGSESARI